MGRKLKQNEIGTLLAEDEELQNQLIAYLTGITGKEVSVEDLLMEIATGDLAIELSKDGISVSYVSSSDGNPMSVDAFVKQAGMSALMELVEHTAEQMNCSAEEVSSKISSGEFTLHYHDGRPFIGMSAYDGSEGSIADAIVSSASVMGEIANDISLQSVIPAVIGSLELVASEDTEAFTKRTIAVAKEMLEDKEITDLVEWLIEKVEQKIGGGR